MADPLIDEPPRAIPYRGVWLPDGRTGDAYTCCHCNRGWRHDDPGFVYWRENADGEVLDGRQGRRRDSLGWFAHCADRDACERRRANSRAEVAPFQLALDGLEPRA